VHGDSDFHDTVWPLVSTNYPRLQTEKDENELEGEGVGGSYLFCSAFPHRFSRTICPPEPCFFFFPCRNPPRRSVFTAVFSVCPPCTSSHSCRVCRLAVRYPVALQLRNGQRNVFSLPFSFSSIGFNPNPRHPFYTYYVFPPRVSAQFLRTNDTILPAYT